MSGQVGTMRCPDLACRAPMIKRTNGQNGSEFYGCSRYPECRETTGIPERERMLAAGAAELPGFETEGN